MAEVAAPSANSPDAQFLFARPLYVKPHHTTSEVEAWDSRAVLFKTTDHLGDRAPSNLWGFESKGGQQQVADRTTRQLVAAIEKLLGRGRWVLLDPILERYISANESALTEVCNGIPRHSINPDAFEFDSPEEREFFNFAVAEYGDPAILCPQLSLSGLTGDPKSQHRRIDFLGVTSAGPLIIEIDGKGHEEERQRAVDRERDKAASDVGIRVQRIPVGQLAESLATLALVPPPLLDAAQFCHAVWVALLWGLKTNHLPTGASEWVVEIEAGHPSPLLIDLTQNAIEAFLRFLANLAALFEVSDHSLGRVLIRIGKAERQIEGAKVAATAAGAVAVHFEPVPPGDLAPGHLYYRELLLDSPIRRRGKAVEPRALKPSKEACQYFLEYLFRHQTFRDGQWEGVRRALEGKDCLVLLPTGHGKSVMYQLAALLRPGVGLVVDPIISLIDDQIDNLSRVGIDRVVGISSQIESPGLKQQLIDQFAAGEYLFCFVAPERFQIPEFRQALRALTANSCVSVIAIDEAHCISEWGHDFRTSYLNLGRNVREYCASGIVVPPLMGLTGTASRAVLKDVKREIGIDDFEAVITPSTFDRPELRFKVLCCQSEEKLARLNGVLTTLPDEFGNSFEKFFGAQGADGHAGIVFCPHVNGDFGTVHVASQLSNTLGIPARHYSGQPPKGAHSGQWNKAKRDVASDFKKNRFSVMVATKAFGMGIDKPNVRFTAHFGIPTSIESFYQEAGRAGRDRKAAICVVVASSDQPMRTAKLLAESTDLAEVKKEMEKVGWDSADDITRVLFFHCGSFKGIEREIENVKGVLDQIRDLDSEKPVTISGGGMELKDLEKAVHRLVTVGLLRDYTLDYANQRIDIRPSGFSKQELATSLTSYVANYQRSRAMALMRELPPQSLPRKDFVLKLVGLLVDFVYAIIEMGRRRAFLEMVQICTPGATDDSVRRRVLAYLERSEFDEILEAIRENLEDDGLIARLLDDIISTNQATSLRGRVARDLESYPDNPGLLFLRGLVEAMCDDADFNIVVASLRNWVKSGIEKHALSESVMAKFYSYAMEAFARHGQGLSAGICEAVFPFVKSREFYSAILSRSRNSVESTLALRELARMQTLDAMKAASELLEVIR